jgi:ATP-dependent Clp protease ATP-binding subunit ClpC
VPPNGLAIAVLRSLAVEPATVREAVEARLGIGTGGRHRERGLTPRAKKAIYLSVEEAQRLRHPYVGTEHILLGLMREGEGIAATVLTELTRVDLTELRRRVVRALNDR